MHGINKVFLLGNLGTPPENKTSKTGNSYVRLNIATHRGVKDSNNQWSERTDWHSIYVWGKKGDLCCKYLRPGQALFIEGYLSYFQIEDSQGNSCKQQAINAVNIEFLPAKNTSQN